MMKFWTKEVKIGLAGVAALFLLIYGINYLKGINIFKPTSYFYIQFEDVTGLTVSSPVFADGYKVGVVRDLTYDYNQRGRVVAEIDVEPSLRIPRGTTAELKTEMLGGAMINLLLANNPRERHEVGDTLPGGPSNGAMEKVAAMMPAVEKMLPKLDSILSSLNTLLADPALANSLHNIERLTANVDASTKQLNVLMHRDIPELTGKLNVIGDNFVTISNSLAKTDFEALLQRVDHTLADVNRLTGQLNSTDNTIGLLLNDPSLYNNLNATSANAASLLEDLQAHPKRYVHFSLFGKKEK